MGAFQASVYPCLSLFLSGFIRLSVATKSRQRRRCERGMKTDGGAKNGARRRKDAAPAAQRCVCRKRQATVVVPKAAQLMVKVRRLRQRR
ncbi:hypothetical protein MTO96_013742 [Rhipicephalus appendiculatus]